MSLKDEIANWTDSDGLVTPNYRPQTKDETGNGILYTSIAHCLMVMRGELRDTYDYNMFYCVMRSCQVPDARPRRLKPVPNVISGLFHRSPNKTQELQGDDDYIGVCAASKLMDAPFAREILKYGRKHRWSFNNLEPGKWTPRTWFGRKPQFVAHVMFSACQMPPLYLRLLWCASLLLSGLSRSSTGWMLSWLMTISAEGISPMCDQAISLWRCLLRRSKFKSMKGVLRDHLNPNGGIEHGLVRYCDL